MTTARELLTAAVVAALLAIFTRTFLVQAFRIPSDSMAPGLLAGDHILVNKFIYRHSPGPGSSGPAATAPSLLPMRGVRRGDVVVFRSPEAPGQRLIKRCLGLPGERLTLDRGRLRVDGRQIDESGYLHHAGAAAEAAPPAATEAPAERGVDFGPAAVPGDRYFFLGDHRQRSRDSRTWGSVSPLALTGRAVLIYWSVQPRDDVVESPGLWDKIEPRPTPAWPARCRWRRIFKRIR